MVAANSWRNSPSLGSSGITTSRVGACRIPAAAMSSSATRKAAGWLAAIWSWTRLRAQVLCSSSGRMLVGSLSIARNV